MELINYSNIPVNLTVKKILIGKLFRFLPNKDMFVILGLRRNSLYGYLEMLIGKYWNKYSIGVYGWYAYNPKNMVFIGRSSKRAIRRCLTKNPTYIKYHIGKQIKLHLIKIYDNYDLYKEYQNSINF